LLNYNIIANSTYIIVNIIKSATVTGIFGIAMVISSAVAVIPNVLSSAIFPIISGMSADKNSLKSQKRLTDYTIRYTLFLTLPIIFTLVIFPEYFILLFSTPEYLDARILLPILAIASLFLGLANALNRVIYAIKKPKLFQNILIVISILFLVVTPLFTFWKSDFGMAIGYILTMTIYLILSFVYVSKHLHIKFPANDIIKMLFSCVVPFLLIYFVKGHIPNMWIAFFVSGIACLLYCLILLKLKFYKNDDLRILRSVSKKVKFLERFVDFISKYAS